MNSLNGELTPEKLARMLDLSAVRAEADADEVRRLAEVAKQYNCICAFVLPAFFAELKRHLADAPDVGLGGVVGFPSGGHGTAIKVAEARELLAQGATELDMVINVGMLRSKRNQYVEDDIRAVVEAADPVPVKVILEAHHLNDEEIIRGSQIAVRAGAAFVKTGTGWVSPGATPHYVRLIKEAVGDAARVKAAGGVRDLATVIEMYHLGATRFGVGLNSGIDILKECSACCSNS
ncbi:MAG: deoxyribose-phosphate aldolase [Pirellulales bacterium]|nr:deoxyribose-phosphate aldolase [Pirellulales bacterium]